MRRLGAPAALCAISATACTQLLDIPDLHRGGCSPDAEFVALAPVTGLGSAPGVQNAQLSRDELTIVFSRSTVEGPPDRPVQRYGDLYLAHRDHRGDGFREPRPLDEVNTAFDEFTGSLSEDLRTLYFDRQDLGSRYEILAATRSTADGVFGAPAVVSLGDGATSNFEPFITADGLYFGSTRRDGLASLFIAAGHGTQFAAPEWLMSLETEESPTAYEDPVVARDGLTIYFAAPPDGAIAKDIWIAGRAARDQPFGPPHPVASVNTARRESPAWISEDGCRLYFMTDRDGPAALWMASRRAP